jgi:hypothetical protein
MSALRLNAVRSPRVWHDLTAVKILQVMLLVGVVCWTTLIGRLLTRTTGARIETSRTIETPRLVDGSQPLIQAADVDLGGDDMDCDNFPLASPEFTTDAQGLELESTLIGPGRRTASISGTQVTEGMTTTICGVQLCVEAINGRNVQLSIEGASVRLPLLLANDRAIDVTTNLITPPEIR